MSANFDFSTLVAPSKAAAELALANFETLAGKNTQMFSKYAEMSISNAKEALQITDVEAFNNYMSKRQEVAKVWADSMAADAKELAKINEEYSKEVAKLFSDEMAKLSKTDAK